MEFFTSLFGVVLSAVRWFGLIGGLIFLIFATPWQISLPILVLILVLVFIFLPSVPIGASSKNQDFPYPDTLSQSNDSLTYRGVKYTIQADMATFHEALNVQTSDPGEVIGKYRGSILRSAKLTSGVKS
jgi:hypothetical protein